MSQWVIRVYYWYVIVSEALLEHLSFELAGNELPKHSACSSVRDCLTQINAASKKGLRLSADVIDVVGPVGV